MSASLALTHRPWWPWARRVAIWAFFGAIAWLLLKQARTIDWAEVFAALRALPGTTLLAAGALAAASFGLYSTYTFWGATSRSTGSARAPWSA